MAKAVDHSENPATADGADIADQEEDDLQIDIKKLGYEFNEGKLRHSETKEPYKFQVKEGDHAFNQKKYEELGEVITDYVYKLLEKEAGLKKVYIPDGAKPSEARSFFFMSKDAKENKEKLLILIHGSGVVRAGQWARRLIINDCLDSGTQLPFIKKAIGDGHAVIVLNTNENTIFGNKENDTPENHALYVWDNFVATAPAKHIAIIAHSYGGIVTVHLTKKRPQALERIYAIAFTDSVHSLAHQEVPKNVTDFYLQRAKNWISSDQPLDTPVSNYRKDCPRVSAGVEKHEMTSWSSMNSIFKFLEERIQSPIKDGGDEDRKQSPIKVGGDEAETLDSKSEL